MPKGVPNKKTKRAYVKKKPGGFAEVLSALADLSGAVNGLAAILIDQKTNLSNDQEPAAVSTQFMFEELARNPLPRTTREFITDLEDTWVHTGRLSVAQEKCLIRNYNKFIKGERFYAA